MKKVLLLCISLATAFVFLSVSAHSNVPACILPASSICIFLIIWLQIPMLEVVNFVYTAEVCSPRGNLMDSP